MEFVFIIAHFTEDSSDVTIPATYIKYSDYSDLFSLISTSNTTHSGLRTLSLLITAEYSAWEWYSWVFVWTTCVEKPLIIFLSPVITFIVILLLPSALTFITLLIHRIRAARAAQRDRAPEDVVRNLPWQVWTGTRWEKHGAGEDTNAAPNVSPPETELEGCFAKKSPDPDHDDSPGTAEDASVSLPNPLPVSQPWFESQVECAICLSEFAKGDKARILPCHHIFHLNEVDEWLIQRKKLVRLFLRGPFHISFTMKPTVPRVQSRCNSTILFYIRASSPLSEPRTWFIIAADAINTCHGKNAFAFHQ